MDYEFAPFTVDAFKKQTGLNAHEHEGIYLRWVNVHLNYQNYLSMQSMNKQLEELTQLVMDRSPMKSEHSV